MKLMTRKQFLNKVAKVTGRKPATVAQALYSHPEFEPTKRETIKHMVRPFFSEAKIKEAADIVLRKRREEK